MNIAKTECCGCGACANVCPTRCISMLEDGEGFSYPVTDAEKCVHCGLCDKVCPVSERDAETTVLSAFGCRALDEEARRDSSSGGVFHELARGVMQRGGCAFGVAMDDDCKGASFRKAETEPELRKLMTSKYVQASVGDAYREAERELKAGREVLFSGTPCHINALRLYLRHAAVSDEKLFCVDLICHGTPSPKLWRAYAGEFERTRNVTLKSVSFRCKEETWRNLGLCLKGRGGNDVTEKLLIPAAKDSYMKLFVACYSLRPSCYACASKKFRLSDLTIGDFWGIENVLPELDDAKGASVVLIRTEKGRRMFEDIRERLRCEETSYQDAVRWNQYEYESAECPARRDEFFRDADALTVEELSKKYLRVSLYRRVRSALGRIYKKIPMGGGYETTVFLRPAVGIFVQLAYADMTTSYLRFLRVMGVLNLLTEPEIRKEAAV